MKNTKKLSSATFKVSILLMLLMFSITLFLGNVSAIWCYQETANISTICGGLNTGNYNNNSYWDETIGGTVNNAYDGDWNTYTRNNGTDISRLYINYTKINNSLESSLWTLKYDILYPRENISIDKSCWDSYNNVVAFRIDSLPSVPITLAGYCRNSTGWKQIFSSGSASSFYMFEEGINWNLGEFIENSQSYNANSYQSANEQFILNLTYDINNFGLAGNLVYNNTNYIGIISGTGNTKLLTANITIPTINGSIPFYWNVSLTNSSGSVFYFNSTNYTQSVQVLNFGICNYTSPINVTILNFTIRDESDNSLVNSWFKGTFIYAGKNYSYQDLTQTANNYSFCSNLNVNLSVSADIQYGATNYLDRTWHLYNQIFNNITTLINLPLLNSSLGTPFYFDVRYGSEVLPDALVEIQKYYTGIGNYTTISIRETDTNGQFQEYLELNQKYRFIVIKDGITLDTIERQSICSATPCTISLQVAESILNPYDPFYDYFAQNVVYNLTYDLNASKIYLNFTDLTGTAQYWRLWVYQGNSSSDNPNTICDLKEYSATGILECDFTGYYGDIIAKVYISRSPEKLVDFLNFVNSNVSTILGASGLLASILILLVIIFTATRNPSIAIMMIPFGFLILKFIGFIPLGWAWIVGLTVFCFWIASKMKT